MLQASSLQKALSSIEAPLKEKHARSKNNVDCLIVICIL